LAAATLAVVVVGPLLTGALHEDGLADTADGLFGGRDRAARLKILRDSNIGTYGALALAGALLLRVSLVASLAPLAALAALGLAHGLGRLATVVLMARLPYARETDEGPGAPMIQHLRPQDLRWAIAVGVLLTLGATLVLHTAAPAGVLGAALLLAGLARRARQDLGGVTGDVLGASCVLVEIGVLLAASIAALGPAVG
jgi:adenosylcobinamide-GDP ribazoletransferase